MKYQGICWYSYDGSNPNIVPFARIVEVEAADREDADRKITKAMDALYEEKGQSVDFLNWYIKEVK